MAIGTEIAIGFYPTSQSPLDERAYNNGIPYVDIDEALALIPLISRHISIRVNIAGVEHRFSNDLTTLSPISDIGTASDIPIVDTGGLFEADNVEDALAELKSQLDSITEESPAFVQNIYTLLLSASSDVAGRIVGATIPSGWTIEVSGTYNLLITHTLTGRKLVNVSVFEIDGSNQRMCIPFAEAYSGITATSSTVLIEGLNPEPLALNVFLTFN